MISSQKHTKRSQFEKIVNFMVAHPDLAKGHIKTSNAKQTSNSLWNRLAVELNSDGPPTRDVHSGKKVWADYKTHLKSKLRKNKNHMSGTGGGPPRFCSLTALEEQVSQLLNMEEAVEGMSVIEYGCQDFSPTERQHVHSLILEDDVCMDDGNKSPVIDIIPSRETPTSSNLRHGNKKENRDSLLQRQVANQISYQENHTKTLQEINKNICKLVEQTEKTNKLQEKKYRLAKDKFEYKKKHNVQLNQIKLDKLKLKQELLDLKLSINKG